MYYSGFGKSLKMTLVLENSGKASKFSIVVRVQLGMQYSLCNTKVRLHQAQLTVQSVD